MDCLESDHVVNKNKHQKKTKKSKNYETELVKTHSHINIQSCCTLQCAEKIMTDAKIEKFLKDRDAKLVECKRRADLTGFSLFWVTFAGSYFAQLSAFKRAREDYVGFGFGMIRNHFHMPKKFKHFFILPISIAFATTAGWVIRRDHLIDCHKLNDISRIDPFYKKDSVSKNVE